jgi:UDP-N-acetylmuramoyl-L-alanyl-D-glutamate--2,6-diaminopimelate ligase
MGDLEKGVKLSGKPYVKIADRVEAIEYGLKLLQPGDLFLLCSKGHETYQAVGNGSFPFDEKVIVQNSFGGISNARK